MYEKFVGIKYALFMDFMLTLNKNTDLNSKQKQ